MIPQIEFTDNGLIAPTREAVTAALWRMMREAFGSNLTQDARTPQGQLVTSLTAAICDQNDAMIELGNQFDPRYAFGKFQEALGAIYFLQRKEAAPSVAQLEFEGISGTVIPEGFIVLDTSGREWVTTAATTVGGAPAEAKCSTLGPIQAAPDTISIFKETIAGVDRVTNPAAAAVGQNPETRANYEHRRRESVSANSKMTNESVRGAVDNLPGVIDCFAYDNFTDSTENVGATSYPVTRNSLLVSVVGGDDYAIAEQILIKGGTGCSFVGNTTVTYRDEASGNPTPPEYEVKFLRPAHVNVLIQLTVIDSDAVSFLKLQEAKQHIVDEFQTGESRARIGGLVLGTAYMCGLDNAAIQPVKIELSIDDGATWSDYIQFGVDEFPVTSVANISVVDL